MKKLQRLASAAGSRPAAAERYLRRRPALFRLALVAWAVLAATACATTLAPPPSAPCQAWVAAQASWRALDAYVEGQIELQRANACALPPAPPPAAPYSAPGQ